jgi:SAM-dependent methyltransferase
VFVEESLKIKEIIEQQNFKNLRVLNIGSADKKFRTYIQPYIERNIIKPLEDRHCKVLNLDLYGGEGIDIRLDFDHLNELHDSFDLVFCCNSFEHAKNKENLGNELVRLTKRGGFIIVTTPYVYPYHLDPIDTLFRPTIEQQMAYIKGVSLIEGAYLHVLSPYESRGKSLPLFAMKLIMLFKSMRYKLMGEKFNIFQDFLRILSPWQVTFLLLKKP